MSLAFSAPARRGLLDKPANAPLSPQEHRAGLDMRPEDSICKRASVNTPLSPSQVAGQKRRIDQVEPEQLGRPATATSSFNSQGQSQQSQGRREDEFYIYDEMTQSSMDIDKEASFLQYSQKACDGRDSSERSADKGCSQESTSMSSLLNLSFGSESGSTSIARRHSPSTSPNRPQKAARQYIAAPSSTAIPTEPEARKVFIQQKAGLLREKVRTAMKNIKDNNQIDRRLMELEAQSLQSWNASSSRSQQQRSPSAHPDAGVDMTPRANSATSTVPSDQGSSRMDLDTRSTPTQPKRSSPALPRAADHNPRPEDVDGPHAIDRYSGCSVERMIAKAKKETAVDGLLKLMKTTAEYDGLDEI